MHSTLVGRDLFPHPGLPLLVRRYRVTAPVPLHGHDFHELVITVRGAAEHQVERGGRCVSQRLLPGDVFVLAPDERHAYLAPKQLEVVNCLFTPALFAGREAELRSVPGLADLLLVEPLFRAETPAERLRLPPAARAALLREADTVAGELEDAAPGFAVAARARFLALLVCLARNWTAAGPGQRAALEGQHAAVAAALACIEERHGEELSLDDLARQAHLSPHYLSELFHRQTGQSPWDYLTTLRLEKAKERLRASDESITAIAFAVGFNDSSYFTRVFRAREGTTPLRWRRQHR